MKKTIIPIIIIITLFLTSCDFNITPTCFITEENLQYINYDLIIKEIQIVNNYKLGLEGKYLVGLITYREQEYRKFLSKYNVEIYLTKRAFATQKTILGDYSEIECYIIKPIKSTYF